MAAAAAQVYLFAIHAPSRIVVRSPHTTVVRELGAGIPISQTFDATADGLQEIRVLLWADRPTHVQFRWTLGALRTFGIVNPISGERSADLRAGFSWQRLGFHRVERSANRPFRLDLQMKASAETAGVGIAASLDDALASGFLTVGGQQRWGDLLFEVRAAGDTIGGRFATTTLPRVSPPWNRIQIWLAFLLALELLVALFVAGHAGSVEPAAPPPARTRFSLVGGAAFVMLVAALGATIALGRAPHRGVDLIDDLYRADMSSGSPLHWTFNIRDSALNGVGKRAIYAHPPSAIRWTVQVPRDARLQAAVGLEPGAWDLSADGVVFGISIEDDARRVDLLTRHVDPLHVPADRDWIPVDIDMSAYAGRTVSLVFRTEPSMSGVPANGRYDWALWGAPRIVTAARRPSRSGEGSR